MSVRDPSYLFDTKEYHDHGAVFWPDFGRLKPDNPLWQLTDIPYRSEPEFETGQILINKERCWSPLQLTIWINDFSDFWYPFTKGDKEAFHMAWRKLDFSYGMPTTRIYPLNGVMCQHDFEGARIFQHRNMSKWSLHRNPHIEGFLQEDKCLSFIDEVREIWSP